MQCNTGRNITDLFQQQHSAYRCQKHAHRDSQKTSEEEECLGKACRAAATHPVAHCTHLMDHWASNVRLSKEAEN